MLSAVEEMTCSQIAGLISFMNGDLLCLIQASNLSFNAESPRADAVSPQSCWAGGLGAADAPANPASHAQHVGVAGGEVLAALLAHFLGPAFLGHGKNRPVAQLLLIRCFSSTAFRRKDSWEPVQSPQILGCWLGCCRYQHSVPLSLLSSLTLPRGELSGGRPVWQC